MARQRARAATTRLSGGQTSIAAVDERGRPIASQRVEQGHALWEAYQGWLALYGPDGEFEDVLDAAAAEEARQEPDTISHRNLKAELDLGDEE